MLGLNLLTVTLPVLWQPHRQCHCRRSVNKCFFQLLVQCNSSDCWRREDCFLLVWLCSRLCCYVTEMQRESTSTLSGLEQSGDCGLLSKCFAEYLFHGLCLQQRWQDRRRQVQTNIFQWYRVVAFLAFVKHVHSVAHVKGDLNLLHIQLTHFVMIQHCSHRK